MFHIEPLAVGLQHPNVGGKNFFRADKEEIMWGERNKCPIVLPLDMGVEV